MHLLFFDILSFPKKNVIENEFADTKAIKSCCINTEISTHKNSIFLFFDIFPLTRPLGQALYF